jgi:hypothetical protein
MGEWDMIGNKFKCLAVSLSMAFASMAHGGLIAFYDFEENTSPSGDVVDGGDNPLNMSKIGSPSVPRQPVTDL